MSLPSESSSLMPYYQALECASQEMLAAARAGDWDSVCRLEGACTVMIAKLRELSRSRQLDEVDQAERMRILRTIVANDAEIRQLCEPLPQLTDPRSFVIHDANASVH